METRRIGNQEVTFGRYNTVVVGSGAAGMNCAVHLYELMRQKGVPDPHERIVVVTGGLALGASRMSGSDKQTYYKMGTSAEVPDSAGQFAQTLTAAGCCHGDLALAEGVGSLREFYHLVQVGVPFPTDPMGSFVGYKTDHDPAERATSAGPKTSRFMSECLQARLEDYRVRIADRQEVAHLLVVDTGRSRRIAGVVTLDQKRLGRSRYAMNVYLADNIVLAAGGPGELYKASVYPKGQFGIHGLAFKAGLAAENLTESQFGLASTKFRWNVSGTYMQAIPRLFSTDSRGADQREFLADFFGSTAQLATNTFLKGYQWPFDPQKIENRRSSLIDILVFGQTQNRRRVFLDFLHNPVGSEPFSIERLGAEARQYLERAGALQARPIDRLEAMNPPAVEIYRENGIDLHREPLEIAVCAQHNNGGFAVNRWWESNIPRTFVIGEMAGTHGVKRPGGSALNAGQVGGLRAAEYIVNVYGGELEDFSPFAGQIDGQLGRLIAKFDRYRRRGVAMPKVVIKEIQQRMSSSAGHIRRLDDAREALKEAVELYKYVAKEGFALGAEKALLWAVRAEHLALASVGYLAAIVTLLERGGGSRGSYLVTAEDGIEVHPEVTDPATGSTLRFKPENESLRGSILRIEYRPRHKRLFGCTSVAPRPVPAYRKAFEPAWRDYREGKIYSDRDG